MKALEFPTAIQLLRVMGAVNLGRFIWRALPLMGVKEGEKDEYFISNIAVLPKYQGQGIGQLLLSHSERKARELGFQRIALTVDAENEGTKAYYKQRRYKIVEYVEVNALKRRIRYPGFYRMAKNL
jgi:ribosomal protein S18 acetylase RimI-like enzyme